MCQWRDAYSHLTPHIPSRPYERRFALAQAPHRSSSAVSPQAPARTRVDLQRQDSIDARRFHRRWQSFAASGPRYCTAAPQAGGSISQANDGSGNDQRSLAFAFERRTNGSRLLDRENDDGNPVLAHQGESCRIHDGEILLDRVVLRQHVETARGGITFWISGINAVDLRGLQYGVAGEFRSPQRGPCIRGEEGIAGAPCQNHDAAFVEMT